jgi:predicted nuclease of restriction endonuclease-like (RecB) superfamily
VTKKSTKTVAKVDPKIIIPAGYKELLNELKEKIRNAQLKAALAVNEELIRLYWDLGKTIVEKHRQEKWGSKVVDNIGLDLQQSFPGEGGFSRSNIFYMRSFYLAYEIVQQAVGQLESLPIFRVPWGHNIVLLTKLKDNDQRLWYAQQTIKNGWSRNVLVMWIESDLYGRKGKAINNFALTLPEPQSDLAVESLKDPYCLDFLTLSREAQEKEIEQGLIDHLQKFLLELGQGFAFVARQYHLEIDGEDSYLDLLFYHFKLKCFVVIELKAGSFKAADVGQVSFYLTAVDRLIKQPEDNPTIGIILCKEKKKITAEYAVSNLKSPIGVSSYTVKFLEELPKELKGKLPTIEEIEAELSVIKEEKPKKPRRKKKR